MWDLIPWGPVLTIGTLIVTISLLAMDERTRRKFAAREEVFEKDGTAKFARLDDLDGWGDRLKQVEMKVERSAERHDKTEREIDKLITEAGALAKETSRLQGSIERLVSHAESERGHKDRENREIRDRLTRIEEKVTQLVERRPV